MAHDLRPDTQEKIERLLLAHLRQTHAAFRRSSNNESSSWAVFEDLDPYHPDGVCALKRSAVESRVALQEYAQALRDWSEFTLHGRIPDWAQNFV